MFGRVFQNENEYNTLINCEFGDFQLLRELCNGSKHFQVQSDQINSTYISSWDNQYWDTLPWGAEGLWIETTTGEIKSITELVEAVRKFWTALFHRHDL